MDSENGETIRAHLLELPGGAEAEGVLRLPLRPEGAEFLVWITPMMNGAAHPSYRLITLFEPGRRQELQRGVLAGAFRFTPAELRLAMELVNGKTPRQAAEILGVTIHTIRTYLKRLYAKTDVRSQAQLVRVLIRASLAVPEAD